MYWVMGLLPFALLLLGFPIFLLLLITSLVVLFGFFNVPMTVVAQDIFNSLNKYALLAVPFFVFAGSLMSRGGISVRLLRWVGSLIGGFRANVPFTSLGFAALFGATSGVTTAATAAIGTLTYPRMREAGYSERFASALITSEGALDNLIPPSIAMIIYGIASDTSIIQLWTAGIGPCILLASFFGAYIYYHSVKVGIVDTGQFSLQGIMAGDARRRLVVGRDRRDHRRNLFRRVLADRGRRRRQRLCHHRQLFHLSRSDARRHIRNRGALDVSHRADLHHRGDRRPLFVAADDQRHRASHRDGDHQPAFRAVGGLAGHQSVPVVHRLLPRSGLRLDHADAASGAGRGLARRRSDSFRRHRRHESDDRHVPSAVRIEHFRHSGAVQDAVGDAVQGLDPVRDLGGDRVADRDLCAGDFADASSTCCSDKRQLRRLRFRSFRRRS